MRTSRFLPKIRWFCLRPRDRVGHGIHHGPRAVVPARTPFVRSISAQPCTLPTRQVVVRTSDLFSQPRSRCPARRWFPPVRWMFVTAVASWQCLRLCRIANSLRRATCIGRAFFSRSTSGVPMVGIPAPSADWSCEPQSVRLEHDPNPSIDLACQIPVCQCRCEIVWPGKLPRRHDVAETSS